MHQRPNPATKNENLCDTEDPKVEVVKRSADGTEEDPFAQEAETDQPLPYSVVPPEKATS